MAERTYACYTCYRVGAQVCTCAGCLETPTRFYYCNAECAQLRRPHGPCECVPVELADKQGCVRWRLHREAVNVCRVCKNAQCHRCTASNVMLSLADRSMICTECAEDALNEHFKVRG